MPYDSLRIRIYKFMITDFFQPQKSEAKASVLQTFQARIKNQQQNTVAEI